MLPPKLAPIRAVIIPIFKTDEEREAVTAAGEKVKQEIAATGLEVVLDTRDDRPGAKHFEWEQKGVPVRIEIGPRDLVAGTCVVKRRDRGKDKTPMPLAGIGAVVAGLMTEMQKDLFDRAEAFRDTHLVKAETYDQPKELLEVDGVGNFVLAHWDGTPETEKKIKDDTKATIRCIPFEDVGREGSGTAYETGACVVTGKPSAQRVVFARAY